MYRWQKNIGYAKLIFNKDIKYKIDKGNAKIYYIGKKLYFEDNFSNNEVECQADPLFRYHLQHQNMEDIFVDYHREDSNTLIANTYKADVIKTKDKLFFCFKNNDDDNVNFNKSFCLTTNAGKKCLCISVNNDNFVLLGKDKYAKIKIQGNLIIIDSIINTFDEKDFIVYQINTEYFKQIEYKDRDKYQKQEDLIPVSDIFRQWSYFTNYMKQIFDEQKEKIGSFTYVYNKEERNISFDISREIYEKNEEFLESVQLNIERSEKTKYKKFLFKDCEIAQEYEDKIRFEYHIININDWDDVPENGKLSISDSTEQKRRENILKKLTSSDILIKISNSELRDTFVASEEIRKGLTEEVAKKVYKKSKPEEVDNYETIDEIIKGAINSPDICLIQGPAGTGKTTIINAIITRLYEKNKDTKFLICAEQHDAVKNIMDRISRNNISYIFSTRNTENIIKDKTQQDILDKCREFLEKYEQKQNDERDNDVYDKLKSAVEADNYTSIISEADNILKSYETKTQYKNILHAIKECAEIIQEKEPNNLNIECSIYLREYCDNLQENSDIKQYLKDKLVKLCDNIVSCNEPDEMYKIIYDFSCVIQSSKIFSDSISKYADTIGGTCAQSYKVEKIEEDKYDYVIIDEAARANPVDVLMPIFYGKHIIMVGDHKQLPHYLNSQVYQEYLNKNTGGEAGLLKQSLFGLFYDKLAKLYREGKITQKRTFMLNKQYRMPATIGSFISTCFYNNNLENGVKEENCKNTYNIFNGKNLVFYDIPTVINNKMYAQKNYVRDIEVDKTIDIVRQILEKNEKPLDIGIISFYKKQSDAIKDKLKDLQGGYPTSVFTNDIDDMCGTVDSFQGKEFDIVILSCVCSDNRLGFLDTEEGKSRINVSLSRAKKLLVIVGDLQTLTKNECFLALDDHIKKDTKASWLIKSGDTEWKIK